MAGRVSGRPWVSHSHFLGFVTWKEGWGAVHSSPGRCEVAHVLSQRWTLTKRLTCPWHYHSKETDPRPSIFPLGLRSNSGTKKIFATCCCRAERGSRSTNRLTAAVAKKPRPGPAHSDFNDCHLLSLRPGHTQGPVIMFRAQAYMVFNLRGAGRQEESLLERHRETGVRGWAARDKLPLLRVWTKTGQGLLKRQESGESCLPGRPKVYSN